MKSLVLFLLTAVGWHISPGAMAEDSIGLLVPSYMTEPFLGDYSEAKNKKWYGLYCKEKYCDVMPTRLEVKTQKTLDCEGKSVIASTLKYHPGHPLFLVDRELGRAKHLLSIYRDDGRKVRRSESIDAKKGAKTWLVKLSKEKRYKIVFPRAYNADAICATKGNLPIKVFLGDKLESTWEKNICSFESLDIPQEFDVLWAGDMDDDGKLDMVIALPQGPYLLLLSSRANVHSQFSWKFPNKPNC